MPYFAIKSRNNFLAVLLIVSFTSSSSRANTNDALQHVPENAWGFVVVHDLTRANAKVDQLLRQLGMIFPAPLTFVKMATGIDEGLALDGELVIAVLPGDSPRSASKPLVLLPVSSYKTFARSIHADTSGDICRMTLLGEDLLVAQDGPCAMLMNVEHRPTMESLLSLSPEPLSALAPLASWLPKQDLALVLMPAGMKQLQKINNSNILRRGKKQVFRAEQSTLPRLFTGFLGADISPQLASHFQLAALGIQIDDQQNCRLSGQLVPQTHRWLANLPIASNNQSAPKLGLSKQPFVFTAGGVVAPGWGAAIAAWLLETEQQQALENGLESLSPELWEREEQAYQALLTGISDCSVVMLPGEQGEPLVGNFLGVATAADTSKYLESLPVVVETWNTLTEQSKSKDQPKFDITPTRVAGKQGYTLTADVAAAVRDPNTPAFNWMLESAFGPAGKLRAHVVAVDSRTLAFGFATVAQMETLLARLEKSSTSAPTADLSRSTVKLMPEGARWKMLLQPQGCLRWVARVVNEFLSPLGAREMELPTLPASPPLGITLDKNSQSWKLELVCPPETLQVLVDCWKSLHPLD